MDSLCNRLDNMPFDNFRKEELIKWLTICFMVLTLGEPLKWFVKLGIFFRRITSTLRTVDYLSKNAIQL